MATTAGDRAPPTRRRPERCRERIRQAEGPRLNPDRRYTVLATDGSRYGPADLAELNAWIAEGRLGPDTLLSPEDSNALIAARTVEGLNFGEGSGPRSQLAPGISPELRSAWFCAAVAVFGPIIPCLGRASSLAALIGLFLAYRARKDHEPNATLALVANIIGLMISVAWTLFLLNRLD